MRYIMTALEFRVRGMVLSATVNNILVISRRSVLLVEKPNKNNRPTANQWQL